MSVKIRPMTYREFESFRIWSIQQQAKDLMEEHRLSHDEARRMAEGDVAKMLPDGFLTANHHFMVIEEVGSKESVGCIWTIHEETNGKKQSFLCDLVIGENKRRQGYATAALTLMEKRAVNAGCQESVLYVSDHNIAAKQLYQKSGYRFHRKVDHGSYMMKQLLFRDN